MKHKNILEYELLKYELLKEVTYSLLSMQRLRDPSDGKIYTMTAFCEEKGIGLSCVSHPRDTVMWVKNISLFEMI